VRQICYMIGKMRYSLCCAVATLPARDGVSCETLKASVVYLLMDARLEVWNLRFYRSFAYFFIHFRPVLDSVAKSDVTCMEPNLSPSVKLTIHLAPPRKFCPVTKLYSRIANWASSTSTEPSTATAKAQNAPPRGRKRRQSTSRSNCY